MAGNLLLASKANGVSIIMAYEDSNKPAVVGHEPIEVSARGVGWAVAILFATVAVAMLMIAALMMYLASARHVEPTVGPVGMPIEVPPGVPAVEIDLPYVLQQLRSQEEAMLTEYGWVDREAGIARIPIQRAIDILAQGHQPPSQQKSDDDDQ